jgi:type II secretory pathway pseudopilin PulG
LLEIMVTVAIIAVLAAVAIPAFTKESRKSKGSTEVAEVIAELGVREDQYRTENGTYVAAAACPAAPSTRGQPSIACIASGGPWEQLRAHVPEKLHCSYEIVTGEGSGTNDPFGFSFTSPEGAWYYIVATCDLDGRASVNAVYFYASTGAQRQVRNEGH